MYARRHQKNAAAASEIRRNFGESSASFREWNQAVTRSSDTTISYIALVVTVRILRLFIEKPPDKCEINDILSGQWFERRGILNLRPPGSFFASLDRENIASSMKRWWPMVSVCSHTPSGDLFGELHHDLLSRPERHPSGTQYTPGWLADGIVKELLESRPNGKLIDPACGSGSFLVRAFARMRKRSSRTNPARLLQRLRGIDRDPLAVFLASANLLCCFGSTWLRNNQADIHLPIKKSDLLSEPQEDRSWDMLAGNPPWLAFRNMEANQQKHLRNLVKELDQDLPKGHLISHTDFSSLYLLRALKLYAAPNASAGMILPRSVLDADQHAGFRGRLLTPSGQLTLVKLWDLEGTRKLFSVPSCVLFCASSSKEKEAGPIPAVRICGTSPNVNTCDKAEKELQTKAAAFHSTNLGTRTIISAISGSNIQNSRTGGYRLLFRQGATLVPRNFWFVDTGNKMGKLRRINSIGTGKQGPSTLFSSIFLSGAVEEEYLFVTAIGNDIIPFGIRNWRIVLLPLKDGRCLDAQAAESIGDHGLGQWLAEAEHLWRKKRGDKAERLNLSGRLNYRLDLTKQQINAPCTVLYPNLQRIVCSASIHWKDIISSFKESKDIVPTGLAVDTALYHFRTGDPQEGDYLAAFLNAPVLDERLEPLRRRNQGNQPNVHKRIFDVAPIPLFDRTSTDHIEIARLGCKCRKIMSKWLKSTPTARYLPLAKCRYEARSLLKEELGEIDDLARNVFDKNGIIS